MTDRASDFVHPQYAKAKKGADIDEPAPIPAEELLERIKRYVAALPTQHRRRFELARRLIGGTVTLLGPQAHIAMAQVRAQAVVDAISTRAQSEQ